MSVYIQASEQISIQKPLCDSWMDHPIYYTDNFVKAIEPDFKEFIAPMVSRRMGKILKRALVISYSLIRKSGIENPDAIITGTGLGCIENTEKFLLMMVKEGEQFLQPTFFMQSTHNTISSQIAVNLKCHGYNNTYAHRGTSFDSCLLDAFMQFQLHSINNALIGSHDEMTHDYFSIMKKIGAWEKSPINTEILRKGDSTGTFCGEVSAGFILENQKREHSMCEVRGIEMLYTPTIEKLKESMDRLLTQSNLTLQDIDAVVLGVNGDRENDTVYRLAINHLFPDLPLLWFKHLFGESFSSSALGLYISAVCLHKHYIPDHMYYNEMRAGKVGNILIYNHFNNKDHTLTLLSSC